MDSGKFFLSCLLWLFFISFMAMLLPLAQGAEKLKFGTGVKISPVFNLPVWAAEEKGFWKENGLEAEWVPFGGGATLERAMAAGSVYIGSTSVINVFSGAARGLPTLLVADLYSPDDSYIWVRTDSRIKEAKNLQGARIGVTRIPGYDHSYIMSILRTLGIGKEAKFVAFGGVPEVIAALRVGHIEAMARPRNMVINLKLAGEIREVAAIHEYFPKEWVGFAMPAHKEWAKKKAETARAAIKAIMQSLDFIRKDPIWAREKMRSQMGFSEEAARVIYGDLVRYYTSDGRITRTAVENVRNFLIEYGVLPKDKTPPAQDLFTMDYIS